MFRGNINGRYQVSSLHQKNPLGVPPKLKLCSVDDDFIVSDQGQAKEELTAQHASRELSELILSCHMDMWNPPKSPQSLSKMGDTCLVPLPHQHHRGPMKICHILKVT
jgi:hypothetical protein